MTLADIKTLLTSVDSGVRHYYSMGTGEAYTCWEETQRLPLVGDDYHCEIGWRFYVHRFTKDEDDTTASALWTALDQHPAIAVQHTVTFEQDTGYIHHIFACECC